MRWMWTTNMDFNWFASIEIIVLKLLKSWPYHRWAFYATSKCMQIKSNQRDTMRRLYGHFLLLLFRLLLLIEFYNTHSWFNLNVGKKKNSNSNKKIDKNIYTPSSEVVPSPPYTADASLVSFQSNGTHFHDRSIGTFCKSFATNKYSHSIT